MGILDISKYKPTGSDETLHTRFTLTLPSLELGTIGGGTNLEPQRSALKIMGIDNTLSPGQNALLFSNIVATTALAGEISLLSALSNGDLMRSHLKLNRK